MQGKSQVLKVEPKKPYYPRHIDPEKYGYICAHCCKRYGEPQVNGYVDLRRCDDCPRLLVN